jgi:hypothetical protein
MKDTNGNVVAEHSQDSESDELTPGIITELGSLPPATLLTEDGLAGVMGKACRESIKRAVARGELPPPVKIMGKNAWTVGSIVRHIEERLESERNKVSRLLEGNTHE